jgi:GR25 family glycosyltransferase involved in LPS biosynthesis
MRPRGFYINLDGSTDRRALIESNIEAIGAQRVIHRYPAQTGDDRAAGISRHELGCFLSHQGIIEQAQDDDLTLIFEDDVHIPANFVRTFPTIIKRANRSSWDVIFLSQTLDYNDVNTLHHVIAAKRKLVGMDRPDFNDFRLLDGARWYRWGAFAYVINPAALPKLRAQIRQAAEEGYRLPIDNLYAQLGKSGALETKVAFPYLVGIHENLASTMADRTKVQIQLCNMVINLFVAGADPSASLSAAKAYLADSELDIDALITSRVVYERLKQP